MRSLLGPAVLAATVACGPVEPGTAGAAPALRAPGQERAEELDPRAVGIGRIVPDLAFTDLDGRAGTLSDFAGRVLVLAVRDVGCPVSRRTAAELARIEDEFRARGVAFLFLDLSEHDTPAAIRADAAEHGFDAPFVHDVAHTLGAALGATTTTEVFVLDGARTLVYRGAIDDRVGRGVALEAPRSAYLRDALESTLARREVLVTATSAPGCLLGIEPRAAAPEDAPTYHREIARIVAQSCVECHRAGGVAPFALETFEQVRGRKAMIARVVEDGVMPPWPAAMGTGPWRDERRLSAADRATLAAWITAGAPEGDAREAPVPREHPEGWLVGEPDLVLSMSEPFAVPAEGMVRFRTFELEPLVGEDLWIQALEVRPEAREVVHHVTVQYRPPEEPARALRRALLPFSPPGDDGWVFLFAYLPGKGPRRYPDGVARFVPKGSRLRFDVHYTPNGRAVSDRTSLGLVLATEAPALVAESRNLWNRDLVLAPLARDVRFMREYPVRHDVLLCAVTPHMHLRGRSMTAELVRPDGSSELLIDVPSWDPSWQLEYVFRTPRFAPAGSRVRVSAVYDNSPDNPANPDPSAWVRDGPQTSDEMMSLVLEWLRPRVTD